MYKRATFTRWRRWLASRGWPLIEPCVLALGQPAALRDYAVAAVQSEDFAGRGDCGERGLLAAGRDEPASPCRWPDARDSLTGARLSPYSGAKCGFPAGSFAFKAKPDWRLRVNTFAYNGLRQGEASPGPC